MHFVAAGHERHGLSPRPPADRATLLRRVTLDLIGLPPTREELHAFLADDGADAYERVVDRLLATPAVRRALGAALDGRLAVQRLVRPPHGARRLQQLRRRSGAGATGSSAR